VTDELALGAAGEAVRDLQARLTRSGFDTAPDQPGTFASATERAVRAFQEQRGLRVDGVASEETFARLVESGYTLGDRLVYLRRPLLRGDDVADLQRRLNGLGFDAGREDGIFGENTHRALREFQRNAGLAVDGVCGPATIGGLERVRAMAAGEIAAVRERELLRNQAPGLQGRRILVAATSGYERFAGLVATALSECGARVQEAAPGAGDSDLAAAANHAGVDLCLAVRPGESAPWRCAYFASGRFSSEAGRRIATSVAREVGAHWPGATTCGKSYAILRETRMAAVVVEPLAPGDAAGMQRLDTAGPALAVAVAAGVRAAFDAPSTST
jgi:N-acetylmuramoyl-L-alanine amidase